MINTSMTSRFLGTIIFSKEEAFSLSRIRIIKKNLVHVHGFPQSLADSDKLGQPEYFGQYGKILKILLTYKNNPETNRKTYSAYITYSNEKEAAFAILAVDSLLIEGKIIRAFFGTTKYCNNFLNNTPCQNLDRCMFLHQLVKEKDIIIDTNTLFSYNEHLELAKKICHFSNPETKNIVLSMPKKQKTVFPNIDFIYLSENEKENYFKSSDISYIRSNSNYNDKKINQFSNNNLNNLNLDKNKFSNNLINNYVYNTNNQNKYLLKNKSIENSSSNFINNVSLRNVLNTPNNEQKSNTTINPNDPYFLYKTFQKPIKHILSVQPFFINISNNISLKELELEYFINELNKNGNNIHTLLEGCLDCINNLQ